MTEVVRVGREREQPDVIETHRLRRIGHPRPQLECALGQGRGLRMGVCPVGGPRREHGRAQGCWLIAGGGVVMGDRRGTLELSAVDLRTAPLEHVRQRQMKLAAFPGKQVVVQRLAEQRVAEGEPVIVARNHDLLGDRFTKRDLETFAVDAGHRCDGVLIEPLPDGDRAQ